MSTIMSLGICHPSRRHSGQAVEDRETRNPCSRPADMDSGSRSRATPGRLAGMTEPLKLRSIRALEREYFARLLRRRHLIPELLDQAARLRHLLGVAFGELAAADI